MAHYAQTGVLVNSRGEILFIHGRAGDVPDHPRGSPYPDFTADNRRRWHALGLVSAESPRIAAREQELQSVNEELATVNGELQNKVSDLSRLNNYMNNLLAGTGVATLFVDHQLHIVRFTPGTTELINLIHSDIGRPVAHIVSNLVGYDHLVDDVRAVLHDLVPRAAEVQTRGGTWFQMRIRPYRTLENVIEGAVITFIDSTDRHREVNDQL